MCGNLIRDIHSGIQLYEIFQYPQQSYCPQETLSASVMSAQPAECLSSASSGPKGSTTPGFGGTTTIGPKSGLTKTVSGNTLSAAAGPTTASHASAELGFIVLVEGVVADVLGVLAWSRRMLMDKSGISSQFHIKLVISV
jgi:hypothetical protein